jgi:hypothetical protein
MAVLLTTVLFIALVAVGLLLMWRFDPGLRRHAEFVTELAAREPVDDDALFDSYFALGQYGEGRMSPELPGQVRQLFAKHMGYPADKLRPDDDLAFFWAQADMGDLIEELESAFGVEFTDEDVERTPCTIRAVSLLIETKRRTKGT